VAGVMLAAIIALVCVGCSPQWKFARSDRTFSRPLSSVSYDAPVATGTVATSTAATGTASPPQALPEEPAASDPEAYVFDRAFDSAVAAIDGRLPDPMSDVSPVQPADYIFGTSLDDPHAVGLDLPPTCYEESPPAAPIFRPRVFPWLKELAGDTCCDYGNYYSWPGMYPLLYGIGGASLLANTSLDGDFQSWYQREARSSGTDNFASFWKNFGEGQYLIPAFAGLGLVGGMFENRPLFSITGEFGDRVTRGYLVGAPPMILMQYCLGGSRPGETRFESRWRPFEDSNSVSGHAFVGAVPFITAAKMCDNPWAKGTFYVCSTFTAWSRVNDDAHYLSQACLGWWMAYLASQAVDRTECEPSCYELAPIISPELSGVGLVVRR